MHAAQRLRHDANMPQSAAAAPGKRLQSAKAPLGIQAPLGVTGGGSTAAPGATAAAAPLSSSALLDAFPVWSDQAGAADSKEDKAAGRYDDPLGQALPRAVQPFCDAWKRAEELLQGNPGVPMVCFAAAAATAGDTQAASSAADSRGKGGKAAAPVASRELEGKLYAGHESFEWLLAVISHVMCAEKHMRPGCYLWELIHPKDKEGAVMRSAAGRYRVKLFLLDTWRSVVVDDRIPVDLFGRPLLVGSRPLQLWPLLLSKAVLKVMATYRSLDAALPSQVAAFQMLTGWPQEDLLDALAGTSMSGGALFNRLEDVLSTTPAAGAPAAAAAGAPAAAAPDTGTPALPAVASCCLLRRSRPQRAPPQLLVLAGASGAGRAQLVARLLAEFPDKFCATVSHTSRPPREHEVEGRDYYFTGKQALLAGVRAKQYLEAARVRVHSRPCDSSAAAAAAAPPQPTSYWYGTSLATVREVSATGKLCVMSLDVQGAQALRSNPRIKGLYLYVSTSTPEVLARRQKQRLAEAPSTLAKKLAWAQQQVAKSSTPALYDAVIPNTSLDEAYASLKEAISTLHPIIRNRLRGLPAYVLDYSDLIAPNSVEKPFLKPVIVSGPHTGERRRLLEMLVSEFPDVFAFPRQHTTRPHDHHARHVAADADELALEAAGSADGSGDRDAAAGAGGPARGSANSSRPGSGASATCTAAPPQQQALCGPQPLVLVREAFEAAAGSGGALVEAHSELFAHSSSAHRFGHSLADLQAVIRAGKLPLLELEAEEAEAVKVTRGVDCLTLFLAPPSLEVHQQRLQDAATESDAEVAERGKAAAELSAVLSNGVFDEVLVNDDADEGYSQLKAAISRLRPDLILPLAAAAAVRAAQHAAASQPAPVVIAGPAGGGREQLIAQLLQRFPKRFAVPRRHSDRKPGKDAASAPAVAAAAADPGVELVKPDVLARLVAQGQVVCSQQEASGSTQVVTADSLADVASAGKMAVLDVGACTPDQLRTLKQHPALHRAFAVHVCSTAALSASLAAGGATDAAVQAALAAAQGSTASLQAAEGLVHAFVQHDDPDEAFLQLQQPLAAAFPWALPPVLQPLVVAAPFGSGKRAVLQRLVRTLPDLLAVPAVVTSKPRAAGDEKGMEVVSLAHAQQMVAEGRFLVHQEVLGHVYGVTRASVRRAQARGKLPLLDMDRVADVAQLKAGGLQGTFVYLQPSSLEALQARITAEFLANPPLHYEPDEAAAAAAARAAGEVAAALRAAGLFDAVITHDAEDVLGTLGQLGLVLHERYPAVVPRSFLWGFGRPLWDPACRTLGLRPLRLVVIGPAASGKSLQCSLLAARFGVPHVNVGDLLYAEVAAKTPAGLEAQQLMDGGRTVPDRILLGLLLARLQQPDCVAQGWVLDGFPHTRTQAEALEAAGHVADKAILLEGPHALLLNRVKYRRVDYATGKVYHLAEPGAMSDAIRPLKPDGTVDTAVLARLSVRHDDSPENVSARLALWDRQVQGLRAVYEDVLLRLPAAGPPAALCGRAQAFIQLEDSLPSGPDEVGPGNVWPLLESWRLQDSTYRLVATLRYKRQQLVQLQQLDGKLFWCGLRELAANCSCLLLAHNPGAWPVVKAGKRLDTGSIQAQQLLLVDSPEPTRLLVSLGMGPQHAALPLPVPPPQVFVLAGPTGAGRSTLAAALLQHMHGRVAAVPVITSIAPAPREGQPASEQQRTSTVLPPDSLSSSGQRQQQQQYLRTRWLQHVSDSHFRRLQQTQQLAGLHSHAGQACGVSMAALQQAGHGGRAAVLVGSLRLAEQLKLELQDTQVVCVYLDVNTASLAARLSRQQNPAEDVGVDAALADAEQQRHLLLALLEQQDEQRREQQAAAPLLAPAASPSQPQTPASSRSAAAAAANKQQTGQDAASVCPPFEPWLLSVSNSDGALQACEARVQATVARLLPAQQRFQPGLLLLQRFPAHAFSGLGPAAQAGAHAAPASSPTPTPTPTPMPAAAASGADGSMDVSAAAGLQLDEDTFSSSSTVLRLQSLTAAGCQLTLPRGRHLLAVSCCPRLLHCVSLHGAAEFALEDADKLLPSAARLHVVHESGSCAALAGGSRQLLFRFLLKAPELCTASLQLQGSSAALQACTRLLLLDAASGQPIPGLSRPQVQLGPAAAKGYVLLGLAEPHADVPAGSWSLCVTSSHKLAPLAELSCVRQAVFSGTYAANLQLVLARCVISPSSSVSLAAAAQLKLPAVAAAADSTPALGSTTPGSCGVSTGSEQRAKAPLSCQLQVFDTAGAKEVVWGAPYQQLVKVTSQQDGWLLLPHLSLPPGRYLLVLQLAPQHSRQWVNPASGETAVPPSWQLQLMPSADDKACPISQDDAWERHFLATQDAWTQQAAAAAAQGAGSTRPGSSGKGAGAAGAAGAGAAAAAKDRQKQAQAALERHLAAAAEAPTHSAAVSQPAHCTAGASTAAAPAGKTTTAAHQAAVHGAGAARKQAAAPATPGRSGNSAGKAAAALAGGGGGGSESADPGTSATAASRDAASAATTPASLHHGRDPQLAQLWPGAIAAAPSAKQPQEAVLCPAAKGAADALSLSPADQLRHIKAGPPAGDVSATTQQPHVADPQQQLAGAAAGLAEAADVRRRLKAAAGRLQAQQAAAFLEQRAAHAAATAAVAARKQELLQQLAPPVVLPAPAVTAATAAGSGGGAHGGAAHKAAGGGKHGGKA